MGKPFTQEKKNNTHNRRPKGTLWASLRAVLQSCEIFQGASKAKHRNLALPDRWLLIPPQQMTRSATTAWWGVEAFAAFVSSASGYLTWLVGAVSLSWHLWREDRPLEILHQGRLRLSEILAEKGANWPCRTPGTRVMWQCKKTSHGKETNCNLGELAAGFDGDPQSQKV